MEEQQDQREEVLQDSHRRYQGLFENAHEGIFVMTTEGRFVEVNPALVRMLGYNSAAQLLAIANQADLYVDPMQHSRLRQACESADKVQGMEVLWKKKNGEPIVVRVSACLVRSEDGLPQYYDGRFSTSPRRNKPRQPHGKTKKTFGKSSIFRMMPFLSPIPLATPFSI